MHQSAVIFFLVTYFAYARSIAVTDNPIVGINALEKDVSPYVDSPFNDTESEKNVSPSEQKVTQEVDTNNLNRGEVMVTSPTDDSDQVMVTEGAIRMEDKSQESVELLHEEMLSLEDDGSNQKEFPSHFGALDKETIALINQQSNDGEYMPSYTDLEGNESVLKDVSNDLQDYLHNNDKIGYPQRNKPMNKQFRQINTQISSNNDKQYVFKRYRNFLRGKVADIKELFFRTYIKPMNRRHDEMMLVENREAPAIKKADRKTSFLRRENEGILRAFYSRAQNYLCSIVPFFKSLICPQISLNKDNVNIRISNKKGNYDLDDYRDIQPSILVTEICPVGTFIPGLNLCLYFVFKKVKFSATKAICESLADGGTLWNANMDAISANEILKTNKIITGKYSAWIDGIYFEDTLSGTGNFDSDYRHWLNLGTVRGRKKSKDNIVLNSNDVDVFYSYSDGRSLYPFICQCPPREVEEHIWGEESSARNNAHQSSYTFYKKK